MKLKIMIILGLILTACSPGPNTPTTTTTVPSTTIPTTTTLPPTTTSTTTTTTPTGTPPGIYVNPNKFPPLNQGSGESKIVRAGYSPNPDDIGAFRINCELSHMRYDDPIVRPGASGGSHLHSFFGNTGTNYASTPESIKNTGNSTCTGGTANRSAYWVPTMIDTATGNPVLNTTQIDKVNFLQVYYKTGYEGVLPHTVQNYPVGLRMVAGNMMATSPQSINIIRYDCGKGESSTIPANCDPGSLLVMSISFPQCWDGVNLDSPDHKSHMAYGAGWPDKGCPSTHPVPLAQVTQNYRYRVTSNTANWRLVSDVGVAPGISGHADWMNGWDPAVFQRVVDNCYRPSLDCSMNLLGDGWMLGDI